MTRDEYDRSVAVALDLLPEEFRDKFMDMAWERGHSCGYSEIYNELMELIDALLPCIAKYGKRMHELGWQYRYEDDR
jgi:hypothetical protein